MDVLRVDISEMDWILAMQLNDDRCTFFIQTLYTKTQNGSKCVVPKNSRREIVFNHHDRIGHFSVDITNSFMQEKYWFSNMKNYIKRYISCCLPCSYNKIPSSKQAGFLHPMKIST